ncbi:MAG: alginate export family protein [Xanthomonadales bacterium]|jgi:hypothetical protein|nr:alginate export family protein [Xanthomonadales bacterium]
MGMLECCMVAGLLAATPKAAAATPNPLPAVETLRDFFGEGKFSAELRVRHEHVEDDAFAAQADALTLRSRFGFRSAAWSGVSGYLEAESVYALHEDYNSTANRRVGFPVVADPEGSEINQAYIAYGFNSATQVLLGRQRLNYDNQRFFGSVAFRQNEQTFDAASLQWSRADLVLRLAYLDKVHRVFGNSNPNASLRQQDLAALLVNASYRFSNDWFPGLSGGQLTGYGYFIENEDVVASSARTIGLRWTSGLPLSEQIRWFYAVELAQQDDFRGGNPSIDASYRLFESGLNWFDGKYQVKLGQERLGGNGRSAFQTPFATLHAFNGWTDRFLVTPADGLRDRYLDASAKIGPGLLSVQWHRFDAERNRRSYGTETGIQYQWPLNPQLTATLKAGKYEAKDFAADVFKAWMFLDYRR